VDVRQLAPTPVGSSVWVRCEVKEVSGRLVSFAVEAWDREERIGEGRHQRALIEVSRFLQRVEAKRAN